MQLLFIILWRFQRWIITFYKFFACEHLEFQPQIHRGHRWFPLEPLENDGKKRWISGIKSSRCVHDGLTGSCLKCCFFCKWRNLIGKGVMLMDIFEHAKKICKVFGIVWNRSTWFWLKWLEDHPVCMSWRLFMLCCFNVFLFVFWILSWEFKVPPTQCHPPKK